MVIKQFTIFLQIVLGQLINRISSGVLDRPANICDKFSTPSVQFNAKKSIFSTGEAAAALIELICLQFSFQQVHFSVPNAFLPFSWKWICCHEAWMAGIQATTNSSS